MKSKCSRCGLVFCLLIGWRLIACGQSSETTLKGIVVDPMEARVGHALITVESKIIKRALECDEVGSFAVQIPAGTYKVVIESPGFKVAKLSKVRVPRGGSEIKVVLQVKPVKYGECPKGQTCIWL